MRSSSKPSTVKYKDNLFPRITAVFFFTAILLVNFAAAQESLSFPLLPQNVVPVPSQDAIVNVSVNDTLYGDLEAKLDTAQPFLRKEVLSELLKPTMDPRVFSVIFEQSFSRLQWIGAQDLAAVGISVTWDLGILTYRIIIPTLYITLRQLDFSPNLRQTGKRSLSNAQFSAVLNVSGGVEAFFAPGSITSTEILNLDGLINLWGIALEGICTLSWNPGAFSLSLDKARAIYDLPIAGGRLMAGIIEGEGISFQTRPELLGLSFGSLYVFSKYDRASSPSIAFSLDANSTIKIMLNGYPVRMMRLTRGKYRIFDLPFSSGLNTLELYITDDTGVDKLLKPSNRYIASETGILVGGQSEYGFSAGVGYDNPEQPYASAFFRYGLDYRLTFSLFTQADLRSALVGGTLIAGTAIGTFSAEAAGIMAWDSRPNPFTYAGTLRYMISIPSQPRFPGFSLTANYVSADFIPPEPVSELADGNEARLRIDTDISGKIGKNFFYGASASWARTFSSPIADSMTFSLNVSYGTDQGFAVGANSLVTINAKGEVIPALSLLAYIVPQTRQNARINVYQTGTGQNSIAVSDSLNLLGGIDVSVQGQNLALGSSDRTRFVASARKQLDIADTTLSGSFNFGGSEGDMDGSVSVKAASAVAFAEGGLAISKPLYDAFVIFIPDKSVRGQKATLTTSSAGAASSTGLPIALPLPSYRETTARIDFPESAANIIADTPETVLYPTYRSGIAYRVGMMKQLVVSGRLVAEDGKPYAYVAGDILDEEGIVRESVFTYEDGTFVAYTISEGTYRISWPAGIGVSSITVPGEAEEFFDLGDIVAKTAEE